jgi:hypothetical protein
LRRKIFVTLDGQFLVQKGGYTNFIIFHNKTKRIYSSRNKYFFEKMYPVHFLRLFGNDILFYS